MSLNWLIPHVQRLRQRWPRLYAFLVNLGKRHFTASLGIYPRPLGDEVGAVSAVLKSSQWNMAYGKGLTHERLESAFAAYIGVAHAVAVNTGGMALQMAVRAFGLKPGEEVLHQVDTCSATALALMNAGCTPIFVDISPETFMMSLEGMKQGMRPSTRAVVITHMWGNPEDPRLAESLRGQRDVVVIEDSCLALGARMAGRMAGSTGDVGVFSFGCMKPIQSGEGGMLVTNDESLARELRAMRHWGDRTIEFGVRDTINLAWNGRMSEIVAAVLIEQLKGYPKHLEALRDAVESFHGVLQTIDGLDLMIGGAEQLRDPSYTQVVLRVDERKIGRSKNALMEALAGKGIQVWHANFELIPTLSFFEDDHWRDWVLRGDTERVHANYHAEFPEAARVFRTTGLGLGKMNFLSASNLKYLSNTLRSILATTPS